MKPTIGRKVWYWGDGDPVHTRDPLQAFDAEIIFVEPTGDVSIVYRDHYGSQYTLHEVALDYPVPSDRHGHFTKASGGYCTWMPYQVQQSQPKGDFYNHADTYNKRAHFQIQLREMMNYSYSLAERITNFNQGN